MCVIFDFKIKESLVKNLKVHVIKFITGILYEK